MANIQEFRMPDAGEGLTEAEIISWKVQPGDTVRLNDPIVEIETAKALVELPCPFAGVVTALLVSEGTTVDVGTAIIAVDTDPDPSAVLSAPAEGAVEPGLIGGPAPGGRTSVLVGYGPKTAAATRRPRIGRAGDRERVPPSVTPVIAAPVAQPAELVVEPAEPMVERAASLLGAVHVLAKPPVRRLAKELGVDLASVRPSGPHGIVTRDDVEASAAESATEPATEPATDSAGNRETRIPVKGVRKATAAAMVASAFTAPHVTEWVSVDVTRMVRLVERLRDDPGFDGVRVSPLLVVAKALLLAVRRNPGMNATWDDAAQEIVVKHYVNLGIAAATPRGLVVPNIKDADRMTLPQLAEAFAALISTAREGRTPPADLAGGTITITNVGVFGIDSGTPILNRGEAAILCFGQVRQLPWVRKGKVRPRWVTQLSLSFDHRLVDGDLGSRALADVAAVLEDPSRALIWS